MHDAPQLAPQSPPTAGQLLSLAWPIVLSRSSQVVVGLADGIMVAHLGPAALAATTTGALNALALFILPIGIVFIVSSFSAQFTGAGDAAGARRYGLYGLGVAALAGVLCIAGTALVPVALGQFSYAPDVRALMTDYLVARLWSGGAAVGMEALGNYYGGLGNTRLPMLANVLAMALNVLGNWLLIDGHLGAPALGVRGAALASTLSTSIAFLALLGYFLRDGRGEGARSAWAGLRLREFRRMLRYGLPSGFNWFFEFLAFTFFINVVVADLGTVALAAMMAVLQVNSTSFMPAFGVASAGAILVGQHLGARAHDLVPRTVRLTLTVCGLWQGLVGILYLAAPLFFLGFFHDERTGSFEFLRIGRRMLMMAAAWQLFDATANTLAEALRAAGDTAFTLWVRVGIAWIVFVPGVLISMRWLGGGDVVAVCWMVIYIGLLAAVLAWRFRSGAWRKFDLTAPGEGPSG
ncbi:MAG TPA: MATE family efflux transporter [Polyangia bacterium]|nr:MATE family efflux transporter [Polyangia bacterium]